jgi:hypothetical protein
VVLDQLADDAGKEILEEMIDAAKGGDMRAADLVLSRIWPVRKGGAQSRWSCRRSGPQPTSCRRWARLPTPWRLAT